MHHFNPQRHAVLIFNKPELLPPVLSLGVFLLGILLISGWAVLAALRLLVSLMYIKF